MNPYQLENLMRNSLLEHLMLAQLVEMLSNECEIYTLTHSKFFWDRACTDTVMYHFSNVIVHSFAFHVRKRFRENIF